MTGPSFVPCRGDAGSRGSSVRLGLLAPLAASLLLAAWPADGERALRAAGDAGGDTSRTEVMRDPDLEPVRHVAGPLAAPDGAFDPGRSRFSVVADGGRIDYRVGAVSALPGRPVKIRLGGEFAGEAGMLRFSDGRARADGAGRWIWTAPERPGVQALRIGVPAARDSVTLNVFVLHPREQVRKGVLNGYRIGSYPEKPLRGDPSYLRPAGFVELPAGDEDLAVSPHFTLGQFACKQPGEPRYLVVSAPLIHKLERILQEVNNSGRAAGTLTVMSGYRTPSYNRAIGNRTTYSRHLWGDAADVFVDTDGDGHMDDWNGDGRSTVADARLLVDLVERTVNRSAGSVRPGGLAPYRRNAAHGPFVHVDARGARARW